MQPRSTLRPTASIPPARLPPGVILGLVVVLGMLGADAAHAQAFRTTSEGLNVGHFVLYPSIAFEYTDDDNVFYSSRELPEDEIIASGIRVVRPRIVMDMPTGASRIRWAYSPVYRDYSSRSFDKTRRYSHFIDFEALRVGPRFTLRAADHLVLGTVELQEVDRGGEAIFGTTPFKSESAEVEVTLGMGARNGISLLPRYTAVTFNDAGSASFFNYRGKQLELRLQHSISLPTQVYAFYSIDGTEQHREEILFDAVSLDGRTAGVGLRQTVNQEIVASLNLGYKTIDFKGGSNSNFAGPVLDANATWQLADATVLGLTAGVQAYQSFFVNNNYYVDSELRLHLTHQVGRSLFWDAGVGFMTNRYADRLDISVTPSTPSSLDCNTTVPDPMNPGGTICVGDGRIDTFESYQPSVGRRRVDHSYHVEIGGGWQMSRMLRLFIGYNSDRRRSNMEQIASGQVIDPFDYSIHRIVFRLEAGWL